MAEKQLKNKPRGSKTIRIPCSEEEYIQLLSNRKLFRPFLNRVLQKHPELFPTDIAKGYKLHGFTTAILGELLNFDKKIFTLCFVIKFSIVFKKSDQIFQLCMNF